MVMNLIPRFHALASSPHRGIGLAKTLTRRPQCVTLPYVASDLARSQLRAASSNASAGNEKPYYITTPIFYVNAAPHVGHLYSMVLADVLKRWQVLKGRKAILSTGVDEHGMKVQRAATLAGSDPKSFCDKGAETLQTLAEYGQISYDHFVRTTAPDHKDAVEYAWTVLQERGHIYMSKHEGWYSVSDETFYPSSGVQLVVEPSTGRKIMASTETGKEVEWTSETNYKFRLSSFKDRLLSYYAENPDFILPKTRMENVVAAVSSGLDDLSVSRPAERLQWGIPVPTDDSQTIYVWLDALINYITKAGYPWTPGEENVGGWPADCQVIGKDIVRFHCIYWPAFLMALDIPPPKQILTHAHWTLGRMKMAKSTGNVVNPFFAINRFGVDTMRFFLTYDGGISNDSDYSNEYIILRYKNKLQDSFGNLTSRILRGKKWDVRNAIHQATSGELDPVGDPIGDPTNIPFQVQYDLITDLPAKFEKRMDGLDSREAVRTVMQLIFKTNAFIQHTYPWRLVNEKSAGSRERLDRVLFLSCEALRVSGILLQPFMPDTMHRLLDMLGVDEGSRDFNFATVGADKAYGVSKVDLGAGHENALFPPLTSYE